MLETPESQCFSAEARESGGGRSAARLQELDREGLFQAEVDRAVDDSESTFAETIFQSVFSVDAVSDSIEDRKSLGGI